LKIRFSKIFQHHGFNFLVRGSFTMMTDGRANPFSHGLIGLPLTLHNHDKKYRKELLPFHWYILMWRKRLTPDDDGYVQRTRGLLARRREPETSNNLGGFKHALAKFLSVMSLIVRECKRSCCCVRNAP
jgi:hypothetical protein